MPSRPEDSAHVTAIYGDWVALNCDVNFPDGHVVPYVVQWWRKVCQIFDTQYFNLSFNCQSFLSILYNKQKIILGKRSPNLHLVR